MQVQFDFWQRLNRDKSGPELLVGCVDQAWNTHGKGAVHDA